MEVFEKLIFTKEMQRGESASFMTIANARSLGLLGAYMANKGTLNGKQFISE